MKRIKYILLTIVFFSCILTALGQLNQKNSANKKQNSKELNYADSVQIQLKSNSLILKKLDSLQKLAEFKNTK